MPIREDFFTGSKPFNPFDRIRFGGGNTKLPINMPSPASTPMPQLPESSIFDQYETHLGNMPNEGNYSPSVWRRILAGLAGGTEGWRSGDPTAAIGAAENVNRMPFQRAMEQWGMQGAGIKERAGLETSRQKQRLEYLEQVLDQKQFEREAGQKDTSLDIQVFDAETRRVNSELTRKRNESLDESAKKRLEAQINNWENTREIQRDNLTLQKGRLGAYRERTDMMGKRDIPFTQQAARYELVKQQIIAENPNFLTEDGSAVRPEFITELERLIQRRLPRRTTDINLPAFNEESDDNNDWEIELAPR